MRAQLLFVLAFALFACRTGDSGEPKLDDTAPAIVDADGDGWADGEDCDDGDAGVNPDAEERCDEVDNDCDGEVDEDAADAETWYADDDLDGYGDPHSTAVACDEPSGHTDDSSDCDDADGDINPDASEACDGVDNDCDGDIDEDAAVAGDSEDCAAIRAARSAASDGTYWVDPAGSGSAVEVLCEMDIDGGGWTQARDVYLAELGTATREYLYTLGSAWYISPTTDLIWDWSSYQVVEGTYYYSTGSLWAESSFACTDGEAGLWGIGCSNGPSGQWKVLPWGSGQDGDAATCPICQDQPDVFGAGACASGVNIWVR